MDRQTTSGKWGVDLGYMGRGKIKWFPSREALEDWLVKGYDSCEGSEKARYEDMLAQLDDGINIVNYDNIDNYGIVNEENIMKKLNITKEQFNKSRYFKNKYGKLEYVTFLH